MNFSSHSVKNNVGNDCRSQKNVVTADRNALAALLSSRGITEFETVSASELTLLPGKTLRGDYHAALIFLMPYFAGEGSLSDGSMISLYARSADYHLLFRGIKREAEERFGAFGFCDSSPFSEVVCAASAGLGVIGRNGLLINEEYGSFCFIGVLLLPAFSGELKKTAAPCRCENCGLCLKACPTGCLSGGGQCLSAVTQKKGELTDGEKELIRSCKTIWGCDRCLLACPHNQRYIRSGKVGLKFFTDTYSAVPITGDGFDERAYAWRGRETLIRNIGLFD